MAGTPCCCSYSKLKYEIANFNAKMQAGLNENIEFIDAYSFLNQKGFGSSDGLHCSNTTYKAIYDYVISEIKKQRKKSGIICRFSAIRRDSMKKRFMLRTVSAVVTAALGMRLFPINANAIEVTNEYEKRLYVNKEGNIEITDAAIALSDYAGLI